MVEELNFDFQFRFLFMPVSNPREHTTCQEGQRSKIVVPTFRLRVSDPLCRKLSNTSCGKLLGSLLCLRTCIGREAYPTPNAGMDAALPALHGTRRSMNLFT
jgi:hypothetical protein